MNFWTRELGVFGSQFLQVEFLLIRRNWRLCGYGLFPRTSKACEGFLGLQVITDDLCRIFEKLQSLWPIFWRKMLSNGVHTPMMLPLSNWTCHDHSSMLAVTDFTKPFVLEAVSLGTELGVVLLQERCSLAFWSTTLSDRIQHKSFYDWELMAVVKAV